MDPKESDNVGIEGLLTDYMQDNVKTQVSNSHVDVRHWGYESWLEAGGPPLEVQTEEDLKKIKTQCENLLKIIDPDPLAADIILSAFVVASENPDFLLPFPKEIVPDSELGLQILSAINEEIPSVQLLKLYLKAGKVNQRILILLNWLLSFREEMRLKSEPPAIFQKVFNKLENGTNYCEPTFLFKVLCSKVSRGECQWQARKSGKKTLFGLYGPRLNTLHSFLHLGTTPFLNSDNGLLIWKDVKACLNSIRGDGWSWGKSSLGVRMKAILVLEYLEEAQQMPETSTKALTSGSDDSCFLAPRPDLMRIRYVLIYSRRKPMPLSIKDQEKSEESSRLKTILLILITMALCGATYKASRDRRSWLPKPNNFLQTSSSLPTPIVSTI